MNSQMRHPQKISPVILIGIYVLYLVIALEVGARFMIAHPKTYALLSRGEFPSDAKWRLDWIKRKKEELAEQKNKIVLGFEYAQPDPLLGWKLKPNVNALPVFYGKTVTTNSRGIRSFSEYSYEKPKNRKRILVLGESFTFGTEVGDDETYPYFLQKFTPQAEIINFGVFGYGFDQMLLYFKNEGAKYHPDIVIIPYFAFDKSRALLGFRDYAKPYFSLNNDELMLKNTPVPPPDEMYRWEWARPKIIDIIRILYRNMLVRSGRYQAMEDQLNDKILNELVSAIRANGSVPVIAYLDGVRDPVRRKDMNETDKQFFKYWMDKKVPCIYLLFYINIVTEKQIDELGLRGKTIIIQREHGHFSSRENAIIAYGIKDTLRRYQLIPQ